MILKKRKGVSLYKKQLIFNRLIIK